MTTGGIVNPLSSEEEKKILESPPKGTFFLLFLYGLAIAVAWFWLFIFRFLAHGPVS